MQSTQKAIFWKEEGRGLAKGPPTTAVLEEEPFYPWRKRVREEEEGELKRS